MPRHAHGRMLGANQYANGNYVGNLGREQTRRVTELHALAREDPLMVATMLSSLELENADLAEQLEALEGHICEASPEVEEVLAALTEMWNHGAETALARPEGSYIRTTKMPKLDQHPAVARLAYLVWAGGVRAMGRHISRPESFDPTTAYKEGRP